jgi:hypothetical protein
MALPEMLIPASRPRPALGRPLIVALTVALVGTLLGVPAGFAWAAIAPRAAVVVTGPGAADILNPETKAFIAADGLFCLIGVVGGLLAGVVAYIVAVRRHGAPAVAGLLLGGLAASLVQWWIGHNMGLAGFRAALLLGRTGATLHAPLSLRAHGALVIWPLTAAIFICLAEMVAGARVAGGGAPAP